MVLLFPMEAKPMEKDYFRAEIDRKLKQRIKLVAVKKEMEMREYLSNLIERELKKEGV